jgi:hypothetical protein
MKILILIQSNNSVFSRIYYDGKMSSSDEEEHVAESMPTEGIVKRPRNIEKAN